MTKARVGRASGFTLLETLVAVTVFGFVLLAIQQGVRYGLLAWETESRVISRSADLDNVDRALRGLVARMDPGSQTDPPQLAGERSRFSFTTDLPTQAGTGLYRHVDVILSVDAAHRLVMGWTPHLHARGRPALSALSEVTLLTGVRAVRFTYLHPNGSGHTGWGDNWAGLYLPRLVRIHLEFPSGDERHWPDIVGKPERDRPRE